MFTKRGQDAPPHYQRSSTNFALRVGASATASNLTAESKFQRPGVKCCQPSADCNADQHGHDKCNRQFDNRQRNLQRGQPVLDIGCRRKLHGRCDFHAGCFRYDEWGRHNHQQRAVCPANGRAHRNRYFAHAACPCGVKFRNNSGRIGQPTPGGYCYQPAEHGDHHSDNRNNRQLFSKQQLPCFACTGEELHGERYVSADRGHSHSGRAFADYVRWK